MFAPLWAPLCKKNPSKSQSQYFQSSSSLTKQFDSKEGFPRWSWNERSFLILNPRYRYPHDFFSCLQLFQAWQSALHQYAPTDVSLIPQSTSLPHPAIKSQCSQDSFWFNSWVNPLHTNYKHQQTRNGIFKGSPWWRSPSYLHCLYSMSNLRPSQSTQPGSSSSLSPVSYRLQC